MTPKLSDEAWALLGMLSRAKSAGLAAPLGFENAYAELRGHGYALGNVITDKGDELFRARFLSSDPKFSTKGTKSPGT